MAADQFGLNYAFLRVVKYSAHFPNSILNCSKIKRVKIFISVVNCIHIPRHVSLPLLDDCHLSDSNDHTQNVHIPAKRKERKEDMFKKKHARKCLSEVKLIDNNTLTYDAILLGSA